MTDERFIAIETKLAHLEMLVEELNSVMTQQQKTIDQLEKAVRTMANKSTDPNQKPPPVNQPPPHY